MAIGRRVDLHSGTAAHALLLNTLRDAGATAAASGVYGVVGTDARRRRLAGHGLASAFGRDVLQIDLRDVLSRYIGDTEKNLAQLFNRAAATGATLFFDESDALFVSRTTVHEANYGCRMVDRS